MSNLLLYSSISETLLHTTSNTHVSARPLAPMNVLTLETRKPGCHLPDVILGKNWLSKNDHIQVITWVLSRPKTDPSSYLEARRNTARASDRFTNLQWNVFNFTLCCSSLQCTDVGWFRWENSDGECSCCCRRLTFFKGTFGPSEMEGLSFSCGPVVDFVQDVLLILNRKETLKNMIETLHVNMYISDVNFGKYPIFLLSSIDDVN